MRSDLIFSLVKHQLIAAKPLEQFVTRSSSKKDSIVKTVVRLLGIFFIALSFIYLFGSNFFGYLKLGSMMNIVEESIAFCMFTSTLFLLFFSTTYLEHTYFRGKDIKLWRLLPIEKSDFFIARFIVNYIFSLLLNVIITIPLIVAIFYYIGFSFYVLLTAIIIFLLLPVIPLLVSSLLVVLKINITKGRNIKIVDFLFNNAPFIVGILYLSGSSSRIMSTVYSGAVTDQMVAIYEYITSIGNLPYFSLLGKSFASGTSLLILIIIAISTFLLSLVIIAPLFDKCMRLVTKASNSNSRSNKKNENIDGLKSNGLFSSLIKRELYILKSEKGFLSESIGEMLIPIILIIVWQVSGSLGDISELLDQFSSSNYFIAIIFSIVSLFAAMVLLSSTSVSREGKLFVLNKILPINVRDIVKAKIIFHLIFMTAIQLVYLVAFCFMFKISFLNLIWMIPLFIINSINISLIGLIIDYSKPKLDWEVGITAMKQNMNGVLGMLAGLIVIAPSLLILFFLDNLIILALLVSIILSFILYKFTISTAKACLS